MARFRKTFLNHPYIQVRQFQDCLFKCDTECMAGKVISQPKLRVRTKI